MNVFEKFEQSLFDKVVWQKVKINDLDFDDIMTEKFSSCNPVAGIRSSSHFFNDLKYFGKLSAIQSPIIAYPYRKHFRILTGTFTLARHKSAMSNYELSKDAETFIFVIPKKPNDVIRKQIIQFDLVSNLLEKCFVSDTTKIDEFLKAWFSKEEGKQSIYASTEWQQLFPNLKTKADLARYLSISSRDL